MIEELGLDNQIQALGVRSEELALDVGERFSTVVARAVSSLPVVMELATPLLTPEGELIALRGKEDEVDETLIESVSEKLGLRLISKKHIYISEIYERTIYVFKKVSQPTIKLPRRNGMAQKRPLS